MRRSYQQLSRIAIPIVILAAGATGACMNPEIEARQWEEIQAVSTSMIEVREYVSALEVLVDSLNRIVLKQDTAIRLLVDFTGAQVPSYRTQ